MGLLQQDRPILILSRGYGRRSTEPLLWRTGETIPGTDRIGDEPSLLARSLRRGAIGIAADRVGLLQRVEADFPGGVVLLDDGFQHHALSRDLDIVIVDDRTLEHPRLLPEGDLREPPSALGRAGIILATSEAARQFALRWKSADAGIFDLRFRSDRIYRWVGREHLPVDARPLLVTGIARPARVGEGVRALGFDPVAHIRYRDHHRYRQGDVDAILRELRRPGGTHIVTTGKDAVKLERFAEVRDLLYVVDLRAEIGRQEEFLAIVGGAIASR
jgi:tetraacyldisaccharide 4'-kinase